MATSNDNYVKSRLRLRAMTLRGVGPYIDGSRLEIRPLTVLCGKNGSGKSTWLRVLDLLKENTDGLPWGFNSADGDVYQIAYTNARYHLQPEDRTGLRDETQLALYGPPGTVGLEFDVVEPFLLPAPQVAIPRGLSPSVHALFLGKLEQADQLRLRFADPRHCTSDELIPNLIEYAELSWKDCSICFDHRLPFSPASALEPLAFEQCSSPSTVWCSPTCFSGGADSKPERVATFRRTTEFTDIRPLTKELDSAEILALIELASSCMRELAKQLLAGFRHVGAVRSVGDKHTADPNDQNIDKRDVGSDGSSAWNCERAFAMGEMQLLPALGETARPTQTVWSHAQSPTLHGFVSKWIWRLTDARIEPTVGTVVGSSPVDAWQEFPTGFLRSPEQPPEWPSNLCVSDPNLNVVVHSCFGGEPQYPKQMSAGFHQIFPMIVQSGIMGQYETTGMENPEAHLHPKLQLDIAEFFLHQANSGKQFIIETHSDLFVRRVLREIHSEGIGIGQENVRIYFARVETRTDEFAGAHVEQMTIANNRVENLPDDFMADDFDESRRAFDTMRGGAPTSDDGDEPDTTTDPDGQ